jgi:GxxExxY protein
MKDLNLNVEENKLFEILHKEKSIGKLNADFVINEVVAIKLVSSKLEIEEKEIISMKTLLRMTNLEVGLVLNFGADGQHKRIYLTNNFKAQNLSENYSYKLNKSNNQN